MTDPEPRLLIGLDVGSTTVKAVVVDPSHRRDPLAGLPAPRDQAAGEGARVPARGSRRSPASPRGSCAGRSSPAPAGGALRAAHRRQVRAGGERGHAGGREAATPRRGSVIELGGQDAKIIIFKEDPETGTQDEDPVDERQVRRRHRRGHRQDQREAARSRADAALRHGLRRHQAAPRRRQVRRVRRDRHQRPAEAGHRRRRADGLALRRDRRAEPLGADARQHAAARTCCCSAGRTPTSAACSRPGGTTSRAIWEERGIAAAGGRRPEGADRDRPRTPQYFARSARSSSARREDASVGVYRGTDAPAPLHRRRAARGEAPRRGGAGLRRGRGRARGVPASATEPPAFTPPDVRAGRRWSRRSSASTAARPRPRPCCSTRTATSWPRPTSSRKGNPIEDTHRDASRRSRQQVDDAGRDARGARRRHHRLRQGHSARTCSRADAALVETVAHAESALHFYDDSTSSATSAARTSSSSSCKNGHVKDFKLNTQCSAGNGYFLQATAAGLRRPGRASTPTSPSPRATMPKFGYGCAVFLQSDIVNFQRQGWTAGGDPGRPRRRAAEEHLAVRRADPEPRRARDDASCCRAARSTTWRRSRRRSTSSSRASGPGRAAARSSCTSTAARPARSAPPSRRCRLWRTAAQTTFIGLDAAERDHVTDTTRNEDTRCYFCKNKCLRTFIDVSVTAPSRSGRPGGRRSPSRAARRRLIIATCEKGTVEDVDAMRDDQDGPRRGQEAATRTSSRSPAREVWKLRQPADAWPTRCPPTRWTAAAQRRERAR